jgi:hypothetical protein
MVFMVAVKKENLYPMGIKGLTRYPKEHIGIGPVAKISNDHYSRNPQLNSTRQHHVSQPGPMGMGISYNEEPIIGELWS